MQLKDYFGSIVLDSRKECCGCFVRYIKQSVFVKADKIAEGFFLQLNSIHEIFWFQACILMLSAKGLFTYRFPNSHKH